jgi:HSP20 family molecular chaperone IbpA
MRKTFKVFLAVMVFLTCPLGTWSGSCVLSSTACAQDQNTNFNKEQAQQDYRVFLQKLKELNAQYKEVTGQIAQVVKEEGVPKWDMGDSQQKIDEIFPRQDTTLIPMSGVSIKDAEKETTVTVELPGIKRDTIKIAVQDGTRLSISATRKTDNETKNLEKAIDLPSAVDPKTAKASYEDGILTIKLTKTGGKEVLIPVR